MEDFHPIDRQVGERIRLRRIQLSMSPTDLARAIGVSPQQIMKYEKGFNRIGAARLWTIVEALKIPVAYLFEEDTGVPEADQDKSSAGAEPNVFPLLKTAAPEDAVFIQKYLSLPQDIRIAARHYIQALSETYSR